MWVLATILAVGILSVIAWQDRQQLQAAVDRELDTWLEEVLA
jgi:hypothetical protein